MKKKFFLSTVALLSLGVLVGCGGGDDPTPTSADPAPTSQEAPTSAEAPVSEATPASEEPPAPTSAEPEALNIGEIKVWCDEAVHALTETQIQAFKASHPTYNFTYTIEDKSESKAAGDMLLDPEAGADVYFFAQDQLARLLTGGAIAQVPNAYKPTVVGLNDEASVKAATIEDKLYAYPATSDNTYFLYYDNTVLDANDVKSLNTIVSKAKAAGKKVYFEYGNAWYNAALFFGAGLHSEWTMDKKGNFVDVDDNYNSEDGRNVVRAMHEMFSDTTTVVNSSANGAFTLGAAALISGTWASSDVKTTLGDKMGVAVLPQFSYGTKTYDMKPFGGFKLVGVKPQSEIDRVKGISQLAIYLTNEASQLQRFEENGWGPSNRAAQQNPVISGNPVLNVCFAQMAVSIPQGQFPGGWWNAANLLGTGAIVENYDPVAMLNTYQTTIEGLIQN